MSIQVRTRLACLIAVLLTAVLLLVAAEGSHRARAATEAAGSAMDAVRSYEAADDIVRDLRIDIGRASRGAENGHAISPTEAAALDARLDALTALAKPARADGVAPATARFVAAGKALVEAGTRTQSPQPLIGTFAHSLRSLESIRDNARHVVARQATAFSRRSVAVTQAWNLVLIVGAIVAAATQLAFALWLRNRVVLPLSRIAMLLARQDEEGAPPEDDLSRNDEIGMLARATGSYRSAASEQREAARRLAHAARYDALTGLLGRQAFDEEIDAIFRRAEASEEIALFSFDLDRFKDINDSAGHAGGDAVLKRVGDVMREVCGGEVIGRLGGDEFAVVQRGVAQPAGARAMATKLLAAFNAEGIGVSIGVALYPQDATEEVRLRHYSDLALYRAKHDGRGLVRFFGSMRGHDSKGATGYVPLPSELGAAITAGDLRLHYQPKMRARNGQIEGIEALVRWQHPSRGLVAPDVFIPVAEKMGQIRALTDWTLKRAIADQKRLAGEGRDVPVFVNISACLLGDPEFGKSALSILEARSGVIGLEITETGVIDDPEFALSNLRAFVDAGLKIAIDDYGSGMSSLSYLKKLPAHELKIDRAFVGELSRSHRDPLIVRSTIDLAHALGLEVTAEGVEKLSAFALLRAMGCDHIQGFLVARPMPLEDLIAFLADGNALAHLNGGEFDASATQSW